MSLDNFPNLSLAVASPINSINRRQRSNTSPSQSICSQKLVSINPQSSLAHLSAPINHSQTPAQDFKQEEDEPEHEQNQSSSIGHENANLCSSAPRSNFKSSLKREAHSPVYLDPDTILLASSNDNFRFTSSDNSNYLTRRVVQCNSNRIRSSDSDVTSISSQDENVNFSRRPKKDNDREIVSLKNKRRTHGQRNKWTKEETEALVRGCNTFAIGQWKAIRDSEPLLSKRSPGDLKDRFRTYFPDAYRQHYPNAKTHISSRVRSVDSNGNPLFGESAIRRERKQFSVEEDAALKRGYLQFGTAWSSIQRDPILASRKATDLRDRFRNAFPDLYAAAGYKPRSRKASGSQAYELSPSPYQQHGTFEAIDLSVYSPYPSRTISHLHPDQYQLPSLDFLKAHGANAFSDFRMMMSSRPMPVGNEAFPFEDSHSAAVTMSPAIPSHLTNITPRPNIATPRPNDTTPRPRTMLTAPSPAEPDSAGIGSNEPAFQPLIPSSTKPPKSLHKTQSSMDLNRFSNFLWADPSCNHLTTEDNIRASISCVAFTDFFDYGSSSTLPRRDDEFFQKQSQVAQTSVGVTGNLGEGGVKLDTSDSPVIPKLEPDFTMLKNINNTTDWLQELEIASQTFPSAFDISCFTSDQILESQDGASCDSSLISGEPPIDPIDDRVIYTGDGMTSEGKPQPQPQSFFLSSAHVRDFLSNSHFIESNNHNLISDPLKKDMGHHAEVTTKASHQSPHVISGGHEKNQRDVRNAEQLNQVTLCPPLNLPPGLNPSPSCSPLSPISSSSSMYSSSSTSSVSLLSSSPTQNRSHFTNI